MDKITTTADTVAFAIHALGFTPTSSVVLILVENHTVTATLRIDANPAIPAGRWAAEATSYVHRIGTVNGVLLLSFEDARAMTPEQFRALDILLALTRRPIRHALLITDGCIRDYQNPGAEEIPFDKVATSTTALELMLGTDLQAKVAADIPPCKTCPAPQALETFREEAPRLDWQRKGTRLKVCSKLIGMILGYQCTGTVTPEDSCV